MISAAALGANFSLISTYVHTHTAGLTQADALVQPPVRGNCIHWIVGHIVCYRNHALHALGQSPVVSEAVQRRHARDSAPVLGDEPGLARIEALLDAYDLSQSRLLAGLDALTAAQAAEVITVIDFTLPRSELLLRFMRHESYHAGQLELLREIALAARGA